jgi:hypothetical protein
MILYHQTVSLSRHEQAFLLDVADEHFPSKLSVVEFNRLIDDAIERNLQEASAEAILLNAILEGKKITDNVVPHLIATDAQVLEAQRKCYVN